MYKKIEKLMKERRMTIYQLAKITGIQQSTIAGWKYGEFKPSYNSLVKIAKAFDVSVSELFTK